VKRISNKNQGKPTHRPEKNGDKQQGVVAENPMPQPADGASTNPKEADKELSLILDESDRNSLALAKTNWFFGEWQALAELDLKSVSNHPERSRFAMLAASAHQQLGDHAKAREYTRLALKWGCPPTVAAQVLVAGVHNTLGRAAALKQDETRITRHFEAAVAITDSKDSTLVSHARSVREMARMGLLPQAAGLVDKKLKETQITRDRPEHQQALIKVLETELLLLHHELALAQQRQQLFRSPDDHVASIPNQSGHLWLEGLKKKAVSQLGQDLWVLEKTNYKRGGFFVEFGATDGVMLSNTWLLEKEFDWKGICSEPNPKSFNALKKNRDCVLSNACIGAVTGEEVDFILADVYGGMVKHVDSDMHGLARKAYAAVKENVLKLTTVSLQDFLIQHNAPKKIDYLSIDTEGSEFEIIENFPFNEWDISMLTIEHNYSPQRHEIKAILEDKGYVCIEKKWDDWYFKP